MCNTLIVTIKPTERGWSLCNYVPSFYRLSAHLYGYRGLNWGKTDLRDKQIRKFISACNSLNSYEAYNGIAPRGSAKAEFDRIFDEINDGSNEGISYQLNNGYDYTTFDSTVGRLLHDLNLWDKISGRDDFNALVGKYLNTVNKKNEYDNFLVRGKISNGDYAKHVNGIMTEYQHFLYEYLTPEDYLKVIGGSPDTEISSKDEVSVIDITAMPETYEHIREKLKLR